MHHDTQASSRRPAGSIRSASRLRAGQGIPDHRDVGGHVPMHLLHQPVLQRGVELGEGLTCGQQVRRRARVQRPVDSVDETRIASFRIAAGHAESGKETKIGGSAHDEGLWLHFAPAVYRSAQ